MSDDARALELGRQLLAQQEADVASADEVRAELHAAIDALEPERLLRFAGRYDGTLKGVPDSPYKGLLDWLTRHTEA